MYQSGTGFVPDEAIIADVHVYLQNPGAEEEREGKPAVGATGDLLNDTLLPKAGLTRGKDVKVCNAIRCRWQGTNELPPRQILDEAMRHCRQYDTGAPQLVVAAGAVSWRATGQGGSITDWRGFTGPERWNGATVFGTLHPADLFRNPKMRLPLMRDWTKVPQVLAGAWPQEPPVFYNLSSDMNGFDAWVTEACIHAPFVAVDTEYDPKSRVLSLIGLGYPGMTSGAQVWVDQVTDKEVLRELMLKLFGNVKAVFHNAMADVPVLESNLGIPYHAYKAIEDGMLMHAVLWSDWAHTLEFTASLYSNYPKAKHLASTDMSAYNAGDVLATVCEYEALSSEFRADSLSEGVYRAQSLPLIPIILKRAAKGIKVNRPRVDAAIKEYQDVANWAHLLAVAKVGWPINIGSDEQLKRHLYEEEEYPVQKHKDTKKPTVDGDAIAELRRHTGHGVDESDKEDNALLVGLAKERISAGADPILEARAVYSAAEQVLSHYLRPLSTVDRIYPQFKIHAQASGRWSTTNPPLAQLPSDLRDIIVPDAGQAWISYDYDQIELRLLAALSNDEPYLRAFREGWDVHTINACDLFGLPKPPYLNDPHGPNENAFWRAEVKWSGKDDLRRVFAKRFVYRLNYGGEPATAGDIPGARQLGLTPDKLKQASYRYLSAHPAMAAWRRRIAEEARTKRVVRTFMGRRRRLLGETKASIREAYNHPMQGGVADILNLTCIEIANALPEATLTYTMHDSATWEVPADKAEESAAVIRDILARPWDVDGIVLHLPATLKPMVMG